MKKLKFYLPLFISLIVSFQMINLGMAQKIKVSQNGHYLVSEDGKPFFYLGDTAWELFHRLSKEDMFH